MTNKTKKWMPLAAGLLAVAALGGGWAWLTRMQAQADADAQSIPVAALAGEVDVIEYTHAEGDIKLVNTGEEWQWAADADFPLVQTYAQSMAAQGAPLTATSLVRSDGAELAQYGLEAPRQTITLHSGDEAITCLVGDVNAYTGEYYLMLEGRPEVYTVSSTLVTAFSYGLNDMLQLDAWPVTGASRIRRVELARADGTGLTLTAQPGADGVTAYALETQDGTAAADETAAKSFLSDITSLSVAACTNYKAGADLLAENGLDTPAATLTVTYAETVPDDSSGEETLLTAVLYVGSQNEDGTFNVQLGGSAALSTMAGDVLESLTATAADSLLPAAQEGAGASQSEAAAQNEALTGSAVS